MMFFLRGNIVYCFIYRWSCNRKCSIATLPREILIKTPLVLIHREDPDFISEINLLIVIVLLKANKHECDLSFH